MRTTLYILQKEFLQIFRNKAMLPILFLMPVVQLLILSFAATYELKEVPYAVVDLDHSSASRELISKMNSTGYFVPVMAGTDINDAVGEMDKGTIKMILQIPKDFNRDLDLAMPVPVQILIDAVDGSSAGLIQSYSQSIIRDFNGERMTQVQMQLGEPSAVKFQKIGIYSVNWYNPDLDYITFMVPGILVVLVSMIGLFLSGMNIVREKEIGTIEQLNVTPIHKSELLFGKLIPFWIIGMFDLLIGLALARYGFQIPFLGSLILILAVAGLYLVVVQAIGLMISTITQTQQQAMFIAWFLMVVFILMGGLFTPIESMPGWAQNMALMNPVAWFIQIMRMVLLKGAGWAEINWMVWNLLAMAIIFMMLAMNRYKKVSI